MRQPIKCFLTLLFMCGIPSLLINLQLRATGMTSSIFELDAEEKLETGEYKVWFKKCSHLLLDLGANRGDTIVRWLTEENYSGRAKTSSIDKVYDLELRKKFCVLSFELNGMFDSRLHTVEKRMRAKGFNVKVKTRTAISDNFSDSTIYIDDVSTHSYGTSLISEKKVNFGGQLHSLGMEQPVRLVDLRSILSCVPTDTELVVKMDIEGGEYNVLRSIIPSGLACSINLLIIEYHDHKLRKGTVPTGINNVAEWLLSGNKCGVKIIHDD